MINCAKDFCQTYTNLGNKSLAKWWELVQEVNMVQHSLILGFICHVHIYFPVGFRVIVRQ